jgi:enamine deaminase RidA (YjgF/YER057c/UK114 family)
MVFLSCGFPTSIRPLTMSKTYLNPSALFPSQQNGFSQGVATVGKTTLYVSGQVGWNAAQQITNPADLGAQARQALENLEIAVRAAGGTRADIVPLRLYIVGEHIHKRPIGARSLTRVFPGREFADQHLDRSFRPSQQRFSDRD